MLRAAFLAVSAIGVALAQHHAAPPPEKPVVLLSGLGSWTHPIATTNPQAQKFFDQGLTLLYGFNRYEALRSFNKAAALDPTAAMPWWGIAMAQGPHVNMDFEGDVKLDEVCKAVSAGLNRQAAPARERAYLEALKNRCPKDDPQAYSTAMRALAQRFPDDPDAASFFAESLLVPVRWRWYTPGGQAAEGVAESERVLEQVLRRYPQHPGANHFYIHAVESSPTPERAIASAERLMGIVPAAGHLVHMPGHIWMVLGDYETAAGVNERAAELDRQYMAATGVTSSYAAYYAHNLQFLLAARLMQGQTAAALRAADALDEAVKPMIDMMAEMLDGFTEVAPLTRLRFGLWDQVLKYPQPSAKLPASIAMHHYARAVAHSARGDQAAAINEQRDFEAARAKVAAEHPWGNNTAGPVLSIASAAIAARVAKSPADAVPHWTKAVALQDALYYDEPADWYYPLRESLGAALLRAGNAPEAESVFREGLRRSPRNGRMLFGLLESLNAQKKTDAAEWVRREFETTWRKADVKLKIETL